MQRDVKANHLWAYHENLRQSFRNVIDILYEIYWSTCGCTNLKQIFTMTLRIVQVWMSGFTAMFFCLLVPSGRRIYKGERTKIKHYPFMASIQIFDVFQCAGSIIKSDLVITASSCLQL